MRRSRDAMRRFAVLRALGDVERHPRAPWLRRALSQRSSRTDYALRLGEAVGAA